MAKNLNQILEESKQLRELEIAELSGLKAEYVAKQEELAVLKEKLERAGNIDAKIAVLNAEIAEVEGYLNPAVEEEVVAEEPAKRPFPGR